MRIAIIEIRPSHTSSLHAMMLALLLVTALLQSGEASLGAPLSPRDLCSTLLQPSSASSPSSGGGGGFLISTDITPSADGTGYEYTPGATYTGETAACISIVPPVLILFIFQL